MIKTFKYLNEKWFRLPLLSMIVGGICFLLLLLNSKIPTSLYVYVVCLFLPLIFLAISGVIGLIKIFKKDYKNGLLLIVSTILLTIIGFFLSTFLYLFNPNDFYADRLEIPKNIKIEKPIYLDYFENYKRPQNILNKKTSNIDFQLYNINQPGIYTYDVWSNKKEKGFYYLKAIEITKNDTLSKKSIFQGSQIKDSISSKNFRRVELKDDFTVYEGDWKKPYAARFELWFHSDSLKTEEKLLSKNYIIEGWQR